MYKLQLIIWTSMEWTFKSTKPQALSCNPKPQNVSVSQRKTLVSHYPVKIQIYHSPPLMTDIIYTPLQVTWPGGGVLPKILDRSVPPGFLNPDPI